jgi:hypothetical protein
LSLESLAARAWHDGEVERCRALIDELFELAPALADPDDQTRPLLDIVTLSLSTGDLLRAARAAALNVELARGLTPHHQMHGAGMQALVETFTARRDSFGELGARVDGQSTRTPRRPVPRT